MTSSSGLLGSAKDAAVRRQAAKEHRCPSRGALDTAAVLRGFPNRRAFLGILAAAPLAVSAQQLGEWIDLFDGHSLTNWRPSENKSSWQVKNGALVANGPRSHLFYNGPVRDASFKNFELDVELTTQPQCNSGVYFHTAYQETGFPEKGFEIQVNNTARGDGGYLERKKTGSLYGLRNIYKQIVPDEKPFRLNVSVRGKNVAIRVNNQLVVDYIEPTPPVIPQGGEKMRFLDHGTFALQCHNDGSKAAYHKVRVRPLPDNLPPYTGAPPVVDEIYREVIDIGRHNVPLVDYHVFLRDGMTLESALRKSRQDGISLGITAPVSQFKDDVSALQWAEAFVGRPAFSALYADGPNWTNQISRETARKFDYVLAGGRNWIEAKSSDDGPQFVDALLQGTIERLSHQAIDLYTFPTYLPKPLQSQAATLWTEDRMSKLIDALVKNQVAVELNDKEHLPSKRFVELGKQAGCKFAFGTGNDGSGDLRRCDYGLQMVEQCKLGWHDFFTPGAWWPKAVERRWI